MTAKADWHLEVIPVGLAKVVKILVSASKIFIGDVYKIIDIAYKLIDRVPSISKISGG